MEELVRVEVSKASLLNNIKQIRNIIGKNTILCACVKANAYGHGLVDAAKIFLNAGADWLSVNAVFEARALRVAGITAPVYLMGYIAQSDIAEVVELDTRLVVYSSETVKKIDEAAGCSGKKVRVHIKVETGVNRQGISCDELHAFAHFIEKLKNVEIEGIATHFANIEDTSDHSYAELQLARFKGAVDALENSGLHIPIKHCANSAATILFSETHFQMVRVGIAAYGMWPSNETCVEYKKRGKNKFRLMAAFSWKTKIAQIKVVSEGECVGYGCTWKTSRKTILVVIPVGYYDGYDRGVSGAYVLIHGSRAAIRGRICMNIIMADVTDIPGVKEGDEVVLIGRSGDEEISVEQFAQWAGTINYEVTTRVNDRIPRGVVE